VSTDSPNVARGTDDAEGAADRRLTDLLVRADDARPIPGWRPLLAGLPLLAPFVALFGPWIALSDSDPHVVDGFVLAQVAPFRNFVIMGLPVVVGAALHTRFGRGGYGTMVVWGFGVLAAWNSARVSIESDLEAGTGTGLWLGLAAAIAIVVCGTVGLLAGEVFETSDDPYWAVRRRSLEPRRERARELLAAADEPGSPVRLGPILVGGGALLVAAGLVLPWARHTVGRSIYLTVAHAAGIGTSRHLLLIAAVLLVVAAVLGLLPERGRRWWPVPAAVAGTLAAGAALAAARGPLGVVGDAAGWRPFLGVRAVIGGGLLVVAGAVVGAAGRRPRTVVAVTAAAAVVAGAAAVVLPGRAEPALAGGPGPFVQVLGGDDGPVLENELAVTRSGHLLVARPDLVRERVGHTWLPVRENDPAGGGPGQPASELAVNGLRISGVVQDDRAEVLVDDDGRGIDAYPPLGYDDAHTWGDGDGALVRFEHSYDPLDGRLVRRQGRDGDWAPLATADRVTGMLPGPRGDLDIPDALAVDGDGHVLVAARDQRNATQVVRYAPDGTGEPERLAGAALPAACDQGPDATEASLGRVLAMDVDPDGNVWLATAATVDDPVVADPAELAFSGSVSGPVTAAPGRLHVLRPDGSLVTVPGDLLPISSLAAARDGTVYVTQVGTRLSGGSWHPRWLGVLALHDAPAHAAGLADPPPPAAGECGTGPVPPTGTSVTRALALPAGAQSLGRIDATHVLALEPRGGTDNVGAPLVDYVVAGPDGTVPLAGQEALPDHDAWGPGVAGPGGLWLFDHAGDLYRLRAPGEAMAAVPLDGAVGGDGPISERRDPVADGTGGIWYLARLHADGPAAYEVGHVAVDGTLSVFPLASGTDPALLSAGPRGAIATVDRNVVRIDAGTGAAVILTGNDGFVDAVELDTGAIALATGYRTAGPEFRSSTVLVLEPDGARRTIVGSEPDPDAAPVLAQQLAAGVASDRLSLAVQDLAAAPGGVVLMADRSGTVAAVDTLTGQVRLVAGTALGDDPGTTPVPGERAELHDIQEVSVDGDRIMIDTPRAAYAIGPQQ